MRKVLAFCGFKQSGKDYSAKRLVTTMGYKKEAFADALREVAFNIIGLPYEEGMTEDIYHTLFEDAPFLQTKHERRRLVCLSIQLLSAVFYAARRKRRCFLYRQRFNRFRLFLLG